MCAPDENILNGVDLSIKAVIGMDSINVTRPIQFKNEQTLIYSSGPHIVMQELSTGKFICQPREEIDSQVTLLKVIHDQEGSKTILGESFSSNFPTLSYQDSEQSRILMHCHLSPSDQIIEVAISKEGNICYTLSYACISAWILKTQRLISYSKIPSGIRRIVSIPNNEDKVILGGRGYLKYWKLWSDRRAIEEEEESLYAGDVIDMQFIPNSNTLLVLCTEAKLIVIEERLKRTIDLRIPATCLAVSSQECLLGYNNEIDTYLIDKNYQLHFLHIFELPIKSGEAICAAYSPDECNTVVMIKCDNSIEVFIVETGECSIVRPFGTSLSIGGIKGITVSTGKEIVCTYGYDKTVRVWTYSKSTVGIAEQIFNDNPCTVAIHPTGYQLAIGFENSLKVFYLLYDSLSLAFSIAKRCEAAVYSPCGKYLAFSQNASISVYDPYTLKPLYTLLEHVGIPHYMRWKNDYLTSVCLHGSVIVWKLKEKIFDLSGEGDAVKQASYDETLDLLACIHSDGRLRVWSENGSKLYYESSERDFVSVIISNELEIIVLGMKNGLIRVMLWPIVMPTEDDTGPECSEWPVHVGPINYLNIAYSTIFTAGQDSMVVCLSAQQIKEGRAKPLIFKKENELLNSLSLIPQPSLDLQVEKIRQLNDSIKTLESDSFESEQQEKKYEEKINEIKIQFEKNLKKINEERQSIMDKIKMKNKEINSNREEKINSHKNKIMIQNDKYNKLINEEFEKYEVVKEEMEMSRERYSNQREEILIAHKEIIDQCEKDYEARISEIMKAFNDLQKKVQNEKKKYETIVLQTDVDFEQTIKKKLKKEKEEIDEEKKRAREFLGKHAKLVRDNASMQKELQLLKEKAVEFSEQNKNLLKEKTNIKEKLVELEKEMEKREEIIKKRENKIKDLRSLHIHLQNYRFVLDQKINSLKDERIPLEEQNKQIQEYRKKLFSDLLEENTIQNTIYKLHNSYEQKNSEALKKNQSLRKEYLNSHNALDQLYSDLANLLEEKDLNKLEVKLKELYYKHVGKDDLYPNDQPAKLTLNEIFLKEKRDNVEKMKNEKEQQENFMQVMYKNMNINKLKVGDEHNKQILLKQQENARLIKECYDLREEKVNLNKKISELEADIKRIKYSIKGGVVPEKKIRVSVAKETPFQEYIKKKIIPPQEIYQIKSKPDFRIRSLIFELEKNRTEYAKQNRKFQEILQ